MKNVIALSALMIAVSAAPVSYEPDTYSALGYAHTTAAPAAPTGGLMSSFEDELKSFLAWWDSKQGGETASPSVRAASSGSVPTPPVVQEPVRPTDALSSSKPKVTSAFGSDPALPTITPTPISSAPTGGKTSLPSSGAAASSPSSAAGASPSGGAKSNGPETAGTSSYKQFKGDGSTGAGWPAMSSWVSDFDSLWELQQTNMAHSCSNIFAQAKVADNSASELSDLKAAIQSVGKSSSVDPRFILAIVMQETGGCVRAWGTTSPDGTVFNPGLMQDHNGAHTCNSGKYSWSSSSYTAGQVQNPCPSSEISGMLQDGTDGTSSGDGLKQTIAQAVSKYSAKDAQSYYIGARIYNSGSYDGSHLGGAGATPCYASDIANRLIGWNGPETPCTAASAN